MKAIVYTVIFFLTMLVLFYSVRVIANSKTADIFVSAKVDENIGYSQKNDSLVLTTNSQRGLSFISQSYNIQLNQPAVKEIPIKQSFTLIPNY